MRFTPTAIPGLIVVDPDVHRDARGYFLETFHAAKYAAGGISAAFVQDNQSSSVRDTLRGLHLQLRRPQGKLIRVAQGEIWDVAVDVRPGTPAFGKWVAVALSAESFRQVYVPPGCAHGFVVLSDVAEVTYKCTELYDPADEVGIAYDDPDLAIDWPVTAPILSERDRQHGRLKDLLPRLERAASGSEDS